MGSKERVTVSEFAARTGFSGGAILKQIKQGNIPAIRLAEGGAYRIPVAALEHVLSGVQGKKGAK